jgi:ubiquinone/menaquinone biosynthesis C-methylase UbiE
VVVDFGCGGGIDVILAAHKVREKGRVVGLDFAPHMIERAKQAIVESGFQDNDIELRVADMGNSQLSNSFAATCALRNRTQSIPKCYKLRSVVLFEFTAIA